MDDSYQKKVARDQLVRLREVTAELPPYVRDFFRSISETTQPRTRTAYAYDIKTFFEFLIDENPAFRGKTTRDIDLESLNRLTASDQQKNASLWLCVPFSDSCISPNASTRM